MVFRTVAPLGAFALLAACSGTPPVDDTAAAVAAPTAPVADKRPTEITQHGITRVDNYAWMKDENWQTVLREPDTLKADIRDHLIAENAYYDASVADLEALRDTLFEEMRGRIKEDDSSIPAADGPWEYYRRFRDGGEYPIFARRPRGGGDEQILYDGDAEKGDSAFFDIGSVSHSPDHDMIVYGVDRLGSEYYTLAVRDLATGEEHSDVIENTSGYAVWDASGDSFFYVERDDNQRPKRVKRHVLGTDPANDPVVYEEADDGLFVGVGKTQSGEYILISSGNRVTGDTRYIPAANPGADPVVIAAREDDLVYDVEHHGDHFYIRTNADDAVDFKLMRAPISAPSRDNWEDVQPHQSGTYFSAFITFKDHLVILERSNAQPRISVRRWDDGSEHEIEFTAAEAYSLSVSSGYEYDTTTVRMYYESPAQPYQAFDYDMETRERTLLKTEEVPSGHNPDLYVVERIDAVAPDGAEVPVVVLRLKSTPLDGSAPLLLYGYGSYGAYISPSFSTSRLSLVDRGMVFALAHIRGGSAKGRQWYLDGKLEKKMNTFTDFNAAASALIDAGYTSRGRIVSYGGSAGGLLVGAAVNLDPGLYGAVLAAVPFVDVINTISDESLPLTPPEWPEWGDPIRSAEAYGWIASYSPYDNIEVGTEYPPVFATGGLTDYRVTYWEPSKWIARLREEATGGPFYLRMNMDAGHGGSAARFERMKETAHLYAFALNEMGLAGVEPASHASE